jgi:hypothetical protein
MAVALGIVLPVLVVRMHADLRLARLGTQEEKRLAARRPLRRFAIHSASAAVAIEASELSLAVEALGRIPAMSTKDGNVTLVRARYALATGEPGALDRLLAWEHPRFRGRAFSGETCRYHAYVVAKALAGARDDARRHRAAARLLGTRDAEIRAYGTWLVALDEDEAGTTDELLLGAALARHEGLVEIAQVLETRATQRALPNGAAPYRR